jgi:hypothetical protein
MLITTHYCSATMRWTKPPTTATYGQPRAGHSMTAVHHKLFIFGGADNGVFFNDLQIFDTDKMNWVQAYVTGTNPGARSRHTANLLPFSLGPVPVSALSPNTSPTSARGSTNCIPTTVLHDNLCRLINIWRWR